MAAKTYQQIQEEADRLFGKGASDAKLQWPQTQQQSAGLAEEKRKRGGVARGWDVGKSWLRPAASAVAGALGGPAAATTIGALLRGVDRPGKSGVGLDLGQAARGAAEGYAAGSLGATARGAMSPGMAPGTATIPATRTEGAMTALKQYFSPGAQALASGAQKLYQFAKDDPAVAAQALKSGLDYYSAAQAQQFEQEQAALQDQLREEERARRNRLAQLLAPALQAQARPYTSSR